MGPADDADLCSGMLYFSLIILILILIIIIIIVYHLVTIQLPVSPSLQDFLAFMDPTNRDYYLLEEGADRIRKGMTMAIGWIVLQAVYQGEDYGLGLGSGFR